MKQKLILLMLLMPLLTWAESLTVTLTPLQHGDENPTFTYWGTFSDSTCNRFFSSSDVTVYKVTVADDVASLVPLTLQNVGDIQGAGYVVPAGAGVLIKSKTTKTSSDTGYANTLSVTYQMTTTGSSSNLSGNQLHATPTAGGTVHVDGTGKYYKFAYGSATEGVYDLTTLGFYWGADDGAPYTASPHKAFLFVPGAASAPMHFALTDMEEETTPTPLESSAEARSEAVKILRNGQLLIQEDGKVYDCMGNTIR